MRDSRFYDLIEQYHLGKLTPAEVEKFETEMIKDPELAEAVQAHRIQWEMQELLAEDVLRAEIQKRFSEFPPGTGVAPARWNRFFRNWIVMAIVLLLATAGVYYFLQNLTKDRQSSPAVPPVQMEQEPAQQQAPEVTKPDSVVTKPNVPVAQAPQAPSTRQLALAYYRAPEGLTGIRGPSDEDTLALATEAFEAKNYRRVVSLLKYLPENERQTALSLRAHAYFGTKNFAASAHDFSELEAGGIYRREAQWFGLLARLAQPGANKDVVKNQLNTILQQPNHPYQKEAEALLKDLNKTNQ